MGSRDALRKFKQVRCKACGQVAPARNYRFDARVCVPCDLWISDLCGDPDCCFCNGRPERPSQAISNDEWNGDA